MTKTTQTLIAGFFLLGVVALAGEIVEITPARTKTMTISGMEITQVEQDSATRNRLITLSAVTSGTEIVSTNDVVVIQKNITIFKVPVSTAEICINQGVATNLYGSLTSDQIDAGLRAVAYTKVTQTIDAE